MIAKNGKEVISVYKDGKLLNSVWAGDKMVWPMVWGDVIEVEDFIALKPSRIYTGVEYTTPEEKDPPLSPSDFRYDKKKRPFTWSNYNDALAQMGGTTARASGGAGIGAELMNEEDISTNRYMAQAYVSLKDLLDGAGLAGSPSFSVSPSGITISLTTVGEIDGTVDYYGHEVHCSAVIRNAFIDEPKIKLNITQAGLYKITLVNDGAVDGFKPVSVFLRGIHVPFYTRTKEGDTVREYPPWVGGKPFVLRRFDQYSTFQIYKDNNIYFILTGAERDCPWIELNGTFNKYLYKDDLGSYSQSINWNIEYIGPVIETETTHGVFPLMSQSKKDGKTTSYAFSSGDRRMYATDFINVSSHVYPNYAYGSGGWQSLSWSGNFTISDRTDAGNRISRVLKDGTVRYSKSHKNIKKYKFTDYQEKFSPNSIICTATGIKDFSMVFNGSSQTVVSVSYEFTPKCVIETIRGSGGGIKTTKLKLYKLKSSKNEGDT